MLNLRAGEWVRVRSREEILATLDASGKLDALPFMPEMFAFCGQKLCVSKRAEKTCDTIEKSGCRRMMDAVHLENVRCDGSAHGGCQARCLIFWKEAWLTRIEESQVGTDPSVYPIGDPASRTTEAHLVAAACRQPGPGSGDEPVYMCQVTELVRATHPLQWWDLRQYIRDLRSGNIGVMDVVRALVFRIVRTILAIPGMKGYGAWVAFHNAIQRMIGGYEFPLLCGRVKGTTPTERLNLRPGELVQVKSYQEILSTLNETNKNRGLSFDPEMVPFCGKTMRVIDRVERIVNERTGKLMQLPNDCIILDGGTCLSVFSDRRFFCPRGIYAYWREIWLKRVGR